MNKEILELKQKREVAIEAMNEMVALTKTEKRAKSEEETTEFARLNTEVDEIDASIAEEEKLERLNKTIKPKEVMKEEEKIAQRFDISRAIAGFKSGNLDGLEKEMHDEVKSSFERAGGTSNGLLIPDFLWKEKRADYTYAGQTTDYSTKVAGLDVTASPSLYGKLGVTIWNGLKSKVNLNFSDGHDAAFVAEGVTVPETTPVRTVDSLDPRRVGGHKGFSNELLSVSEVMATEFADMITSIDRALSVEVLNKAVAANVLAGFGTADTAANLSYQNAMNMLAGLETETFRSEAFVASKPVYHNAQGIEKVSNSGRFIIEGKAIDGIRTYGTTQLPIHDTNKYDLIYGDFSKSYIGFFGGATEMLIDPYTDAKLGVTNIVFNRLADVALNPAGFSSIRNISLA